MFNALVVNKDEDSGKTDAAVQQISLDDLPHGDVTVAVEYSTVNYKDGLCIGPGGGLVRKYPHVPGIDFAGTVEESSDDPLQKRRQGGVDRVACGRSALGRVLPKSTGQG